MKAISEQLMLYDAQRPTPQDGEVLVKVVAAGVNRGDFPIEKVQVVAGQNRPDTKRAKDILSGVPSDFSGERQFHTMPELFPEELT